MGFGYHYINYYRIYVRFEGVWGNKNELFVERRAKTLDFWNDAGIDNFRHYVDFKLDNNHSADMQN